MQPRIRASVCPPAVEDASRGKCGLKQARNGMERFTALQPVSPAVFPPPSPADVAIDACRISSFLKALLAAISRHEWNRRFLPVSSQSEQLIHCIWIPAIVIRLTVRYPFSSRTCSVCPASCSLAIGSLYFDAERDMFCVPMIYCLQRSVYSVFFHVHVV